MPRGSQPGERRGGRKAGTPNRATLLVQETLARLGCDPFEIMALIAMDEDNPPELRGKMAAELAQYIQPKRKAIEHSGPGGTALISVQAFDELIRRASADDDEEDDDLPAVN